MDYSMDSPDSGTEDGFMEELDYMEFNFDAPAPTISRSLRPPNPYEDMELYNLRAAAADIRERAMVLLQEIDQFEVQSKERDRLVLVSRTKKLVASELKGANKCLDMAIPDRKTLNSIEHSNLVYYEALWSLAKTCEEITHFRRHVYHNRKHHVKHSNLTPPNGNGIKEDETYVDIIAQNGLDWVKLSRVTEDRLLREIFKSGWADRKEDEISDDEDHKDKIDLLRIMTRIAQASSRTRVRCRHPSVRLVLPNIGMDASQPVIDLFDEIRSLGILIQTKEDLPTTAVPMSKQILDRMTADRFSRFTSVLNLDTTVIIAMVSDISNRIVQPQDWHHEQLSSQMRCELYEKTLTRKIWPACGSHKLVCTREAANKLREISDKIGTAEEKARTALLLGTSPFSSTQEQAVQEFQKLSTYPVPLDLQIPLQIIDVDIPAMRSQVPQGMNEVFDHLVEMNLSTFLFGWTSGLTTLSSNGVVIKAFENIIEKNDIAEPAIGYPDIWHCPVTRSLVGTERDYQLSSTTQRRALQRR